MAFVAVEDKRFWEHGGIDWRAVARAARDNLRAGAVVSGASTITMQLARLLHPAERGWPAKVREAAWALRLEWHLSKQEILEQYLNRVQLGQAAMGVGAAAQLYMGASAAELSVGEAALLAGLARAPSRDNPITSPRRAGARRAVSIARMRRAGAVSEEDAERALAEPALTRHTAEPFLAPHFTTRVLLSLGASADGQRVRTTLDAALQAEVEGEVRHTVALLADRGVRHAAAVVLDNATGDVLVWVGSPDFWEPRNGQTDMVVSPRQPGSALKPFLYGLAFDRGTTPATILPDVPTTYSTATGPYQPRNYDRRFRGPVRAREALASSYNVPAVGLADRVGAGALLHTLHLAGFTTLRHTPEYYGLGLALGNGDVTLLDLANAYRALANRGVYRPWRWTPTTGAPPEGRRVISPEAAALVLDILSDPVARVPGFGAATPFDFPFRTAAKTGTSRHFTDNWAVATTEGFTVAVWAGNFAGQPMEGVSGITGAGPLLHRVVTLTAAHYPAGRLVRPEEAGLRSAAICGISGMLATSQCPGMREWFIAGTEPSRADTWLRDGRVRLPVEFAAWVDQAGAGWLLGDDELEPAVPEGDWGPAPEAPVRRGFHIVSPSDGDVYRRSPGVPDAYATIALRAAGEAGTVRWFVDGVPFNGARWSLRAGTHVIRAESQSGPAVEVTIRVE
jgi:penicillin-binding protein 1C